MVAIAILVAGILTTVASHEPFESKLVRLEAQRALPTLEASLEQASPELNALFSKLRRRSGAVDERFFGDFAPRR
ncbi:hypothetical protein HORIV_24800 [Vreelandella olivaria]|uniref:Uncharacterized protein n=1 Tax=Vreelandella olivaria TaxID=390919 RepID=A0ABN5WSW8_9GAMM|nr:hypothetical protein HORIV_24800 [Halomonas olivaria]